MRLPALAKLAAGVLTIARVIFLGACGGGESTPSATVVSVELVRF